MQEEDASHEKGQTEFPQHRLVKRLVAQRAGARSSGLMAPRQQINSPRSSEREGVRNALVQWAGEKSVDFSALGIVGLILVS